MNQAGGSGPLRLDLTDERLWDGEQVIPLAPTAFSMLRYFVTNPNRLLTKEKILEAVWPDTLVTESLVKDYVRSLRRAIGDDSKRPRFIETVRGRGYQYLGGIELTSVRTGQISQTARSPSSPLPLPDKPSIAVLPFTSMSSDPEHEFFADGRLGSRP